MNAINFRYGFAKPTISQQGEFNEEDCAEWKRKEIGTIEKIRKTLDFMRQQFNEVPFIAFYRKEYIRPELQINDLWRVYHFDELWCKLQTRKRNLKLLYQNMMAYQGKCCNRKFTSHSEVNFIVRDCTMFSNKYF